MTASETASKVRLGSAFRFSICVMLEDASIWYLCCNMSTIAADVQGVLDIRNCKGMFSFMIQELYLDVEHLGLKCLYQWFLQAAGCVSKMLLLVRSGH